MMFDSGGWEACLVDVKPNLSLRVQFSPHDWDSHVKDHKHIPFGSNGSIQTSTVQAHVRCMSYGSSTLSAFTGYIVKVTVNSAHG